MELAGAVTDTGAETRRFLPAILAQILALLVTQLVTLPDLDPDIDIGRFDRFGGEV
jgi:hypothetical protein